MPIVNINNFSRGIADDYTRGAVGQCSVVKQFDTFTYPFRLHPLRGMVNTNEPTDSGIGNMILGENGGMYAVGYNPANTTQGELYKRTGFGASDVWQDFTNDQLASNATEVRYDFLVHFPEMGAARKLFWADPTVIIATDPTDANSTDTEPLVNTYVGQGIVHPKDKILYFPYLSSSGASIIGKIATHASDAFGTINFTAFTLSDRFKVYCLSYFGDYLAIPMTIVGAPSDSYVGLWDRDTTLTTLNQSINWGKGLLKVLNNLNGALIGVSVLSAELGSGAAQDQDKIQIKVYEGGAEPFLVKELTATRLTTTNPSCVVNHRVNFVRNNRLYFSANVVNGDSDSNYYGLWSVGKNKFGEWTVILERVATNDNSETGVIAAAMYGDFLSTAHTSAGTLTYTVNGNVLSSIYGATSVYESTINPEMSDDHKRLRKRLVGVYATYLPLPAAGQVVMKYRVNSNKDDSWTTIFTETTDDETLTEAVTDANKNQFPDFENVEFRLESTGGAVITGFGYKYEPQKSQI